MASRIKTSKTGFVALLQADVRRCRLSPPVEEPCDTYVGLLHWDINEADKADAHAQ